ncbi:hypothetical protein OROHE_018543 [Orobanche hederae]
MEEVEPPECPVCLQPYDAVSSVPRVLSCGHTTCEVCLKQLPRPLPNTLRCTVCTLLVKIPITLSALPKNLDLLHFSSVLQRCRPAEDKKGNSPSSPPENEKNKSILFPLNVKSWSYEFYRKWKKWVIPKDCILIEKMGLDKDGVVASGKVVQSFGSYQVMGFLFRERENVGLVKVGFFLEGEDDSKFFESSYESRIVTVLNGMKAEERDELGMILNATLRASNVGKACGFWYNEDDNCVYMVWQKFTSSNLMKFVLKNDGGKERLSRDEISGLGMFGIETCEILTRLHLEGLVTGFLSVSCIVFDDFGRVYIDLSEVLNAGRRVNMAVRGVHKDLEVNSKSNLLNENLVFISPEMLLQFVDKGGFEFVWEKSNHKVGYASDVWSIASLLVWLVVGSSFVQETESFMNFLLNAIIGGDGCDYAGLYMSWMEKTAKMLKCRLGSECDSIREILCKCLDYDPGNRPVITDLWKCLRELCIKPKFDIGHSLRQEVKKENSGKCIVLGEMCHIVEEIDHELINGVTGNENSNRNDVEFRVDGDVVEGMSRGRLKCIEMKGHLDCITGLALGGGFLFSSSYDKIVHVWSLQIASIQQINSRSVAQNLLRQKVVHLDYKHVHSFKGHEHRVMAVVFVDGEQPLCISGDNDGVICIWEASFPFSEVPIRKLHEKKDWRYSGIHAMAISGTEHLYTGSGDKLVKAWSLQRGSWDGTVRLWSLSDHSPLTSLGEDKTGNVASVLSLSADNDLLFVGHDNGRIKIWHDDILVETTQAQRGAIFSIGKKGKWLFSGGLDKKINIQEISEDVNGVDVTPVGSIPCDSTITALLYWHGKLFVGQADRSIKVYHGV